MGFYFIIVRVVGVVLVAWVLVYYWVRQFVVDWYVVRLVVSMFIISMVPVVSSPMLQRMNSNRSSKLVLSIVGEAVSYFLMFVVMHGWILITMII